MIIEGLTMTLAGHAIEVAGHARSIDDVIPQYRNCTPDVIVLDIRFANAGPSGLDVARDLIRQYPDVRIVIYSQFDQNEVVQEAYRLGCAAFVAKSAPVDVLAEAIREANDGKTFFMPEIAARLAMLNVKGDDSPRGRLDEREMAVFLRMARGQTNSEIAEAMNLSTKTVSIISQGIKDKLGVSRPAVLTLLAVKHRLIEP